MSRPVSWLPRLHQIRRSVAGSARSHYGRRELELLFGVSAKAAGRMMEMLATDRAGNSHLVARETLAGFLDQVQESEDVGALFERLRAEREKITRTKARYMRLTDMPDLRDASLPANISLERGELRITFARGEQLAAAMLTIATMIIADPVVFAERFEPVQTIEISAEAEDMRQLTLELDRLEQLHNAKKRALSKKESAQDVTAAEISAASTYAS